MATLKRKEFAYLFNKITKEYKRILKDYGIPLPDTMGGTWGVNEHLHVGDPKKISKQHNSISHVVFYTIRDSFDFKGFRNFSREFLNGTGHLLFQGRVLRRAYSQIIKGNKTIEISDRYLNAYLHFIDKDLSKIRKKAKTFNNEVEDILPILKSKQKNLPTSKSQEISTSQQDSTDSEIAYDIFLASPKLTLGKKIDVYFEEFRASVKEAQGEHYTKELDNILIKHFFGCNPPDLDGEYLRFEQYIEAVVKGLRDIGFQVHDSREEVKLEEMFGSDNATDQLKSDKRVMERCKTYLLITPYPRLFTSAFVEAGMAIEMGKPSMFICREPKDDLVWVLQDGSQTLQFTNRNMEHFFRISINKRVKNTVKSIKEWSAFHCKSCFEEIGNPGWKGNVKCPDCDGRGFHTLKYPKKT